MAQSVTLSSLGTATIALNPVAKSTTVQLIFSSSGTISVEMTLDDPTLVPLGGPALTWSLLSSAAAMQSSTAGTTAGLVYTILSPIGGVRLNSSTGTTTGGPFTLKAIQSVTA